MSHYVITTYLSTIETQLLHFLNKLAVTSQNFLVVIVFIIRKTYLSLPEQTV